MDEQNTNEIKPEGIPVEPEPSAAPNPAPTEAIETATQENLIIEKPVLMEPTAAQTPPQTEAAAPLMAGYSVR